MPFRHGCEEQHPLGTAGDQSLAIKLDASNFRCSTNNDATVLLPVSGSTGA